MKKRILACILIAVMALSFAPAVQAVSPGSKGQASGELFTETLTTDMAGVKFDTSFNMVFVEGGTFTLGWEASDASMRPESVNPVRGVTVSDFYIGETEVTISLWNAVMGLAQPGADANRPKENVTFYQVQEFLDRLYVLTGRTYRLLTEAEWEFAAKGGNPGKEGNAEYPGDNHKYLFAGSNNHDEVVASRSSVQNVKTKKPNILGIYDLCGNAEEWVYNSFDASLMGGVDPIGPGGIFHTQKTRRGGIYGGLPDSTRTLVARQIRSIDGGAGVGFRIALSGDMNSVPPGMVRPRDVVHPSIDERNLPVTYRDQRLVTGDNLVWENDSNMFTPFSMKLWDTGEMVIRSPGFEDRIGQWYSVSNLGIVFVENAFTENEKRMTLPYMFLTENFATIVNDVSFSGDGAPIHRMERHADAGTGIEKPTGITLYAPEDLAAASKHDHTSYDLKNITEEMKGHDERLVDGEGYGWYLSALAMGAHQYRQDFTDSIFRFVVFSPSFGNGTGGANPGYGGNYLAQGSWYTVNDMLLVVGSGTSARHYLYAVTDEVNSYIRPGQKVHQLMEISYMGYERGDSRYLECHPNASVTGYSNEIPAGFAWPPEKPTTFMTAQEEETLCPGGCGNVISKCTCPTMCPTCHEHVSNCYCNDTPQRLDAGVTAAKAAFAAYTGANGTTEAHLDAVARLGIGYHNIERSWTGIRKTNATRDAAGSITGTLTLSLNGSSRTVDVNVVIPRLPETKPVTLTPASTIGGKTVTMTATGMDENFTMFDIMSIFGASGGPFTYAMWFDNGGTFSFNQDVTLSKSYYDSAFAVQGTDSVLVKAGEVIRVADGVYSEVNGKTVPWSEFSVTLDDGNSWMIVYAGEPGNYGAFPPDVPLSEFPSRKYNPDVTVKGVPVAWTDAAPFNDENGRMLSPLRAVAEALGLEVTWDREKREAVFSDGSKTIYFPIGSNLARSGDGSTIEMNTAAVIVGDRTYAPVRYLAEFFGYTVEWDAANRTAVIN